MNKTIILFVVIALAVVGIGAWLLMNSAGAPQSQPISGTTAAPVTPVRENAPRMPVASSSTPHTATEKDFTVAAQNYSFEPSTITVRKGGAVVITLKSVNGYHDLKIDAFGAATKRLSAGQKDTVRFIANKAGTFEYYCSVDGHRAMGMKGAFLVTE